MRLDSGLVVAPDKEGRRLPHDSSGFSLNHGREMKHRVGLWVSTVNTTHTSPFCVMRQSSLTL